MNYNAHHYSQTGYPWYSQQILQKVSGEVLFGSPKNRCAGHGICAVNIYDDEPLITEQTEAKCTTAEGLFTMTQGTVLRCRFLRREVCSCLLAKYFSASFLTLSEPFDVSLERQYLLTVPAGKHPVIYTSRFIKVLFQLLPR